MCGCSNLSLARWLALYRQRKVTCQPIVFGPRDEHIRTAESTPHVPILKFRVPCTREGQGRPCVLNVHRPAVHRAGRMPCTSESKSSQSLCSWVLANSNSRWPEDQLVANMRTEMNALVTYIRCASRAISGKHQTADFERASRSDFAFAAFGVYRASAG